MRSDAKRQYKKTCLHRCLTLIGLFLHCFNQIIDVIVNSNALSMTINFFVLTSSGDNDINVKISPIIYINLANNATVVIAKI